MSRKRIAILGSTGSIGTQTLDVIERFPDKFEVVGLTTNGNVELLAEQANKFGPHFIGAASREINADSITCLNGSIPYHGSDCSRRLVEECDIDLLVVATVGFTGVEPTLKAIDRGIPIALANKEVLVVAGDLVMKHCREKNVPILPIDSEHNAIFQCIGQEDPAKIQKLLLTASGGPFRGWSPEQLADVTVEQALNHPTWNMGPKVTIDSATLMNKGFEVIEAHHLYGVDVDRIEVLIHPQSICHSMVEYIDGSILAQMGRTDMRLPIQNCLTWPERKDCGQKSLDWAALGALQFENPDMETFRCLRLAMEATKACGTLPTVLNAADEVAVERFLKGEIAFLRIAEIIDAAMQAHDRADLTSLEQIFEIDAWARQIATSA